MPVAKLKRLSNFVLRFRCKEMLFAIQASSGPVTRPGSVVSPETVMWVG